MFGVHRLLGQLERCLKHSLPLSVPKWGVKNVQSLTFYIKIYVSVTNRTYERINLQNIVYLLTCKYVHVYAMLVCIYNDLYTNSIQSVGEAASQLNIRTKTKFILRNQYKNRSFINAKVDVEIIILTYEYNFLPNR